MCTGFSTVEFAMGKQIVTDGSAVLIVQFGSRAKLSVAVPPPFGSVTVTLAAPAVPGGTVAVIDVDVTDETAAGALPTVTVAPATKFAPAMFTTVPPVVGPELGVTEVTVTGEEDCGV